MPPHAGYIARGPQRVAAVDRINRAVENNRRSRVIPWSPRQGQPLAPPHHHTLTCCLYKGPSSLQTNLRFLVGRPAGGSPAPAASPPPPAFVSRPTQSSSGAGARTSTALVMISRALMIVRGDEEGDATGLLPLLVVHRARTTESSRRGPHQLSCRKQSAIPSHPMATSPGAASCTPTPPHTNLLPLQRPFFPSDEPPLLSRATFWRLSSPGSLTASAGLRIATSPI